MDSRDSNVQQNYPTLCRNGCGFYSHAGNDGLCSVCSQETVKKKQAPPTGMPASLAPTPGSMASLSIEEGGSSLSSLGAATGNSSSNSLQTASPTVTVLPDKEVEEGGPGVEQGEEREEGRDGKKKKNRCISCKKKVGLTGFTCRCGGLFCSLHRYSDKHECGFDYKALGAEEISKSNPVVVAEKVAKI